MCACTFDTVLRGWRHTGPLRLLKVYTPINDLLHDDVGTGSTRMHPWVERSLANQHCVLSREKVGWGAAGEEKGRGRETGGRLGRRRGWRV